MHSVFIFFQSKNQIIFDFFSSFSRFFSIQFSFFSWLLSRWNVTFNNILFKNVLWDQQWNSNKKVWERWRVLMEKFRYFLFLRRYFSVYINIYVCNDDFNFFGSLFWLIEVSDWVEKKLRRRRKIFSGSGRENFLFSCFRRSGNE